METRKYRKAFDQFCKRHSVTAAERVQLVEFLAFLKMRQVLRTLCD